MLLTWYIFVLTLPAILAVGKKRSHAADGTDDGDDDSFPDGFFDIPDAHKSIKRLEQTVFEGSQTQMYGRCIIGRGSRVNLASRLFYHYHPSPILQSEDRPPFLNNSASLPSLSTDNISNTPVHGNLQDTVNSQTEKYLRLLAYLTFAFDLHRHDVRIRPVLLPFLPGTLLIGHHQPVSFKLHRLTSGPVVPFPLIYQHKSDWSTPKGSLYRQLLCTHCVFPRVQLLNVQKYHFCPFDFLKKWCIYIYIYMYK